MTTYPYGYGTGRKTLEEMEARYGLDAAIPAHPAFWEAFKAAMIALDGKLGVGGAYRFTQPDKPGFAPPGKSFHERQTFASGFEGYSAIDTVWTNPGGAHRSPTWAEIEAVKPFGLHAFITGEPWHVQAQNIRGYTSWVNAGRPDPQTGYPLPPDPPPSEDDMNTAVIWRHPDYIGAYLVGVGVPLILTPELKQHYLTQGVPEIAEAHDQLLEQCATATGYTPIPKG